ncbi:hypothetical protein AURDEDRAFT_167982 [Auricularia subglabra TFB-10046 SS5]|nr:hypothetical protein AURDEDRAFT_167982 [Auricularia subglabra TFB-10046 SS5]
MSLDDADLYGDLYGADDPEYAEGPQQTAQETKHEPAEAAPAASSTPPKSAAPAAEPEASSSKPAPPAPAPIPSLADEPPKPQPIPSYSSQIAEQFNSTYKQPGPERHGLPSNPQLHQQQLGSPGDAAGSSVRPSQMKDEG